MTKAQLSGVGGATCTLYLVASWGCWSMSILTIRMSCSEGSRSCASPCVRHPP